MCNFRHSNSKSLVYYSVSPFDAEYITPCCLGVCICLFLNYHGYIFDSSFVEEKTKWRCQLCEQGQGTYGWVYSGQQKILFSPVRGERKLQRTAASRKADGYR